MQALAAPPVPAPGCRLTAAGIAEIENVRRSVSRVLSPPRANSGRATVIPLDRSLLSGSRDLPGHLRPASPAPKSAVSLFGLAPGGACRAGPVARPAVGSYPTLSPLPPKGRFAFCGAIPRVTPGGRYPPPFRRGARTFLDKAETSPRPPDRLTRRQLPDDTPLVQHSGHALGAGQLQQPHQPRARLAIGDAVDVGLPPVALEGRDRRLGRRVIDA